MVLSAGLGTRLRPLTEELPKALVPVGDQPLLGHLLGFLREQGLGSAVVNAHHLAREFAQRNWPLPVELVYEPVLRGTAGGVAGARHLLGPAPVLVWNGDVWAEPPIGDLLGRVSDGLCLAIAPRPREAGTVGLDDRGHVVRLRGERFGTETRGGDYIGVAALGARCLATLPDHGCLIGDWALPELRRGGKVLAIDALGPWTDCGGLGSYLRANLDWLERRGLGAWQAPDAKVDPRVTLQQSIVGAGASVTGEGTVERSVIWPGASVVAPLSEVVATRSGRVVRLDQG